VNRQGHEVWPGVRRVAAGSAAARCPDRGQALLWFALMLPFLLGIVGLATDVGTAYIQRQALQTLADDAARTGAEHLDLPRYYAGDQAALDPQAARQAALTYLAEVAPGTPADVRADQQHVAVTVQRAVPLPFLAAIGLRTATVRAEGVATVAYQGN
jgi:Flp pilus assembly protein TadG